MKTRLLFGALALVVATAAITSHAVSQEDQVKPPAPEEMMKRWQAAATPGTPHKWLAKLAGEWTTETTMWMGGPGSPPMKMTGSAEFEMILGGRYLEQELEGKMMGQDWGAVGLMGYDNFEKRFVSTWADAAGTGITIFHGHSNRDGKTVRFYGAMNEPTLNMFGKYSMFEWKLVDENTLVITGYDLGLGPNAKVMQVTSKRVNATDATEDKEEKEDD